MIQPKFLLPNFWVLLFFVIAVQIHAQEKSTLFSLLPKSNTGINFKNELFESDTLNILNQANIYNGGGVGVGDFNNDGLMDIYFAANMVSNQLYLNQGNFTFRDITNISNTNGQGRWCTGVTVVDINADGWQDIYVSASFMADKKLRTNLLYINKGLDKKGIPVFEESAEIYGLADNGFSTQAYFLDYDHDGDLDLYQVTNEIYDPRTPIRFRAKLTDGSAKNTDRLYRNNGNNTFTDVSNQAGITIEGWGHSAVVSDFNSDGWPDIYVANDFISNDVLYINNKNGTFSNQLDDYFKHTGWNAMGTDAVDFNNDGRPDVISLEMLPENNLRKKRMLSGNEYYNYINNQQYGYNHQYVRNVLQMNSGPTPKGHPVFNDVGFMAGVYQTDWSWCPLAADFDNDGFRDLIITNGLPRDVTDLDYIAYESGQTAGIQNFSLAMTDKLPVVELPNYAFKNSGGNGFIETSKEWGIDQQSFSNGGAYADLDNDGDLDVVINNINGPAFVYRNNSKKSNQSLSISFQGPTSNPNGIGAQVTMHSKQGQQHYEHYPYRGYLSTNDERAHFGVPTLKLVDSLAVVWSDGKSETISEIDSRNISLDYKNARSKNSITSSGESTLLKSANSAYNINFKPLETDFSDYNIQPTLPHKLSQYGPGIAVGDIDGNGWDDFYVGGSSDNPGVFFMQQNDGSFTQDQSRFLQKEDVLYEDMGVLFFDADGDGDLDLYMVSGSYEIPDKHGISNDRFFLNDGKGMFARANALPGDFTNGSCVKAADFDGDGDLDLFVGGRVVSAAYPKAPKSFIMRNDNGKFTDVTESFLPGIENLGMITDALWTDFDSDGKPDLIVTGEWMPVTFLKNTGNSFERVSTGIENRQGWWNSITSGDFDNDGDLDYVVGNLGLNSNYAATPEEPMTLIAKDMDQNGSMDATVFCYMTGDDGIRKAYPIASRDDLVGQVVSMRKKFPTYTSYGLADMNDLWNESDKQGAIVLKANEMRTSYIENKGNGKFEMRALPREAQQAPVYGSLATDLDADGNFDVLLVGNDYGMDPYSGRHDAFTGLYLKGDGKGNFISVPLEKSGFFVNGDAKGLATVHTAKNKDIIIATQNQDDLLAFEMDNMEVKEWINLNPDDFSAEIWYKNGTHQKKELYYGSTYLSQSSRKMAIQKNMKKITITNYKGEKRNVL